MKITELKGKSHVFTMKDKKTFRIFARETKTISDSNISKEIKLAEALGLILLTKDSVKTTKKSGGTQ